MSKGPFKGGSRGDRINFRGEPYRLVVQRILERDVFGRPRRVELLYDEETTRVEDGDAFAIVLMHESHFRKEDKGL